MLMKDVKIGRVYRAKVSGRITTVIIVADRGHASYGRRRHLGWIARNESTGKQVYIRSAARLTNMLDVPVIERPFPVVTPAWGYHNYVLVNGNETTSTTNGAEFIEWIADIVIGCNYVAFNGESKKINNEDWFTLTCE